MIRKDIIIQFNLSTINKIYLPLIENKSRYLHIYGGAGSGKSVFAAQKLIIRLMMEQGNRFLLIRKVAKTIRNSQFSLLKSLIYNSGLQNYFSIKESELRIINEHTRSEVISAGVDDPEKLKSIFGITSIWIEEATELEYNDFLQIDLRLRGRTRYYKQIILTYNPVNSYHWLNTTEQKNSTKLRTTYRDNKYIDDEYKNVLLNLKNQDENFYNIYTLGEWGTLKNIIYKPFEIREEYPLSYDEIIYGLDFGYNNKTALIKIGIKEKEYYLEELLYKEHLTNGDIICLMKKMGISGNDYIYCDASEPERIEELRRNGFNSIPADKNVKAGIDFLKRCKIFSNSKNEGINKEVLHYSYKQDKNGNILDEPVKFNDHCMDAIRYAIYTHNKSRMQVNIRYL
ncbi:MAG: PBSX family phage terminase large subunit [Ignavibacteria bacterium]|nr:PBSX family phage terminase large subunit [Ignavibacteria bacterium]